MSIFRDFIELFFPRTCSICGKKLLEGEDGICIGCQIGLPEALAARGADNFVEKRFWGRVPVESATSLLIFKQNNKTQTTLHQIKYRGDTKLADIMGQRMGQWIIETGRFNSVDMMVPVPLHRRKERKRGYNQSLLLCQGIAKVFERPVSTGNLVRLKKTDTQTRKNREQRMDNMAGVFAVKNPEELENKHILLIDDVITTGATTEACYQAMKDIAGLRISIASLAVSGDT